MLLTPLEWAVLRVARCAYAFRRLLIGLLVVLAALRALDWLVHRPLFTAEPPAVDAPPPANNLALWNPGRLDELIRRFVLPAPPTEGGRHAPPERHRTESMCREILEYMLQMPLPKVRPAWLVNPTTKRRLELDMYNEEHHIAFEYDGAQHDVYTPH